MKGTSTSNDAAGKGTQGNSGTQGTQGTTGTQGTQGTQETWELREPMELKEPWELRKQRNHGNHGNPMNYCDKILLLTPGTLLRILGTIKYCFLTKEWEWKYGMKFRDRLT